jgi:hypothetical protein
MSATRIGGSINLNGRSDAVIAGSALAKPTLETKFHIDFEWWVREGRELRVDVAKHLRPEFHDSLGSHGSGQTIDAIDPETAEVRPVDEMQYALRTLTRPLEEFLTEHTTLVDAVFHVFLANGNQPLSPNDLSERINRPAQTILRTLAGRVVYKGLRPFVEE